MTLRDELLQLITEVTSGEPVQLGWGEPEDIVNAIWPRLAGLDRNERDLWRMYENCEMCDYRVDPQTGSKSVSPCPAHLGGEGAAIGVEEDEDGEEAIFFYCPNCSQRTGDDVGPRYKAQAVLARLESFALGNPELKSLIAKAKNLHAPEHD